MKKKGYYGSPNMSDTTILVSVEDLINIAMGPPDVNKVNFKMIQTVLHILARQLRILETNVEIRISEIPPPREKKEKKKHPEPPSPDSSSSKSPRKTSPPPKSPKKEERVKLFQDRDKERAAKAAANATAKEKEKAEKEAIKAKEREAKMTAKEREKAVKEREKMEKAELKDKEKAKDRAERAESKEREKAERAQSKERDRASRAESKERDKADRASSKEREKADRAESREREKEKDKAERSALKDKEKMEKTDAKDREKAEKEKEKLEKMSAKDREKAEKEQEKLAKMSAKDREKAEKEQEKLEKMSAKDREKAEKEQEKLEKMSAKDREKAEKEQEKLEKMSAKDREKAEKDQAKLEKMDVKEREKAEKEREKAEKEQEKLEKMSAKDREKAEKEQEKLEKMSAKDREKAEKEQAKLEKMDVKEREKAEKEREKAEKEQEKLEKMSAKDREKAEKEQAKLEKMSAKDREKAEKEQEKLEKMSAKDREKAEKEQARLEKMDAKEREKAEKEQEKLEKMSAKDREKAEKEQARLEKMDAKEREKAEREQEKLEKMSAKDREKAEKEQARLEKMDVKEREKAEKEQEKLEKMSAKDREKAEKEQAKLEKMSAKDREKAEKEQEKLEKMSAKDREKAEKEKEKLEKMSAKDREKAEKEKEKLEKLEAKERERAEREKEVAKPAKTGISVKERDKVLIVEKGPTTRSDSRTRVGSIEVVTVSEFEMLEAVVKDLMEKAGPLPFPALPDNQKLRSDLAKGSASLTDTMQAMQVAARVQAAETAIERMAGLLTQLAAAGALPRDVAGKLEEVKAEMDAISEEAGKQRTPAGVSRKSVAIDPMSKKGSATKMEAKPSPAGHRPSTTSRASIASKASIGAPGVTHIELDDALRSLKDDLTKNVTFLTAKATAAAESASATAKSVSDKLDIALKLNTRINSLYSLVTDYAEQLNGFDAGLTTQMQSFQEQMVQMRGDLKGGITLLETANNNAETAAVMELTERYEGLVTELDNTVHAHQALTAFQKQLGDELHSLLECVEMLREQKADRDEVLDGLRDKADNSRLAGLLTESEFASSRTELERRLDLCYDKFRKQEQVWMGAIKDLTDISEGKAEIMQLLAAKEDAQQQLRDIQDRLHKLDIILGEPKAAMLTRKLSKGARCGSCQVPALQEPTDISYGKPPLLPAVRPPPAGEEEPCIPEWRPPQPPDGRDHTCHRWVGGSHTLLADSVVREQAGPMPSLGPPTKRYTGYGTDGRLYMMEEELQPCVECYTIPTEPDKILEEDLNPGAATQADGAGDTGVIQTTLELPV